MTRFLAWLHDLRIRIGQWYGSRCKICGAPTHFRFDGYDKSECENGHTSR